jgi:tetratricopeptide (TPR) repeat protein
LIIETKNKNAADQFIYRLSIFNDSVYAAILKTHMLMTFYKKDKSAIRDLIDSIDLIVKDRFDSADVELLRGKFAIGFDKDYDEAYEHFITAVNLVPDDIDYISDLIDFLDQYREYSKMENLIKENMANYSAEDQKSLSAMLGVSYLGQRKLKDAFNEFKKLHSSGAITCAEMKDLNKLLKKFPEYNEYMKNCKD